MINRTQDDWRALIARNRALLQETENVAWQGGTPRHAGGGRLRMRRRPRFRG